MEQMYVALMLYAAVNGSATFAERFGVWAPYQSRPYIAVAAPKTTRVGVRSRTKVAKPLNILKYCKGS